MNVFQILKRLLYQLFLLPRHIFLRVVGAMVIIVIGVAANVVHPLILRSIINSMSACTGPTASNAAITLDVGHVGLFLLLSYGLIWTISYAYANIAWFLCKYPIDYLAGDMCKTAFIKILQLPFSYYNNQRFYKAIANLEKVFHAVPGIFNDFIIYVIPETIELILTLIVITYLYGIMYGILICGLFVIFFGSMAYTIRKAAWSDQEYRDQFETITLQINDALSNFETVKIFNAEEYERKRLERTLFQFGELCKKRSFLLDGMPVIQMIVTGIIITLFTVISGYFVYQGFMNAGDFILINSYLLALSLPVTYIGYVFAEMYRALSSLYGFFELFDLAPNGSNALLTSYALPETSSMSIVFDHVSFMHDNKEQIVENISFEIAQGASLAIIGVSGSGKSTCARLLLKLLEPTQGSITIDGIDIKNISAHDIRKVIGFIPQECVIFSGTLKDNLLYGTTSQCTDQELMDTIKLVGFDKVVQELPYGLDTHIDEAEFSNGEKQSISFIRAIMRNPRMYIFDEPTSALDLQTEKNLINAMSTITKNYTSVIITHTLSLAQTCQKIIVLEEGKMVEYGTHEELIKKHGIYYDMWQQECS